MLVKSNFSFSHNVSKTCWLLMRQNEYLWSKGLKELQESMGRCTGHRHITEILLKTALNTIQSINHSIYPTQTNSILNLKNHGLFCCLQTPLILSPHIDSFYHIEEKSFGKTQWLKVKLLILSNFTFFRNVFYAICILKSCNNHVTIVVCSFLEFGVVSKCCICECVNLDRSKILSSLAEINPLPHNAAF